MIYQNRNNDLELTDDAFIKICKINFFKGSGPGGQKKNKTSNAVRLTHLATDLTSQASESRQQSVNRSYAIKRLRLLLAEKIRLPHKIWQHQWRINEKNTLHPLFIANILDTLKDYNWKISDAANFHQLSTNQFSQICFRYQSLLTAVNQERLKLDLPLLRQKK